MDGESQTPRPIIKPSGQAKLSPGQAQADKPIDTASKGISGPQSNAEEPGGERGTLTVPNKPSLDPKSSESISKQVPYKASSTTEFLDKGIPESRTKHQSCGKSTISSSDYLEEQIIQQIRRRKKEIVDRLMDAYLECIDHRIESTYEWDSGSSRSQNSDDLRMAQAPRPILGRKRRLSSDSQNQQEREEDKNEAKRNQTNKRAKITNVDQEYRFACPFYKFDESRYKNRRTCCGPGFRTIHRLKEHLNRTHRLPKFQCNRCFELFKEDSELKEHQRATKPCPVKTELRNLSDGFDQEQSDKLQKKSKRLPGEKWADWYCILFHVEPGSPDIPSPYHCISSASDAQPPPSQLNFQLQLHEFRQDIVHLIQGHVEAEVDKIFIGAENAVRKAASKSISQDIPALVDRYFQSKGPTMEANTSEDNELRSQADPPRELAPEIDGNEIFSQIQFNFEDLSYDDFRNGFFEQPPEDFEECLFDGNDAPCDASDTDLSRRSSETSLDQLGKQFLVDAEGSEGSSKK